VVLEPCRRSGLGLGFTLFSCDPIVSWGIQGAKKNEGQVGFTLKDLENTGYPVGLRGKIRELF